MCSIYIARVWILTNNNNTHNIAWQTSYHCKSYQKVQHKSNRHIIQRYVTRIAQINKHWIHCVTLQKMQDKYELWSTVEVFNRHLITGTKSDLNSCANNNKQRRWHFIDTPSTTDTCKSNKCCYSTTGFIFSLTGILFSSYSWLCQVCLLGMLLQVFTGHTPFLSPTTSKHLRKLSLYHYS